MKRIGVIGYGSMGKMLLRKFSESDSVNNAELRISSRTLTKIEKAPEKYLICRSNIELARASDMIFICTRPVDIIAVLDEIADELDEETLIISLNSCIPLDSLEKIRKLKYAKVIPSLTAEISRSQTLVTYNGLVNDQDKETLTDLLTCIGNVIELPENELGMGAELVSCMPGFIAAMFDVICGEAKKHTSIPEEQIIKMVLNTISSTSDLMIQKDMSFENVVNRVATKGGITEAGTSVIKDRFPEIADEMFEKTLANRRKTVFIR